MACEDKLTGNIDRDCAYTPAQGVLEAYLINLTDIDRAASTVAGGKITSLTLNTGAKIYSIASIDTGLGLAANGVQAEFGMQYTHTQRLRILDGTGATWDKLEEIKNGNFVSLVRTKDGSSEETNYYKVGGYSFGMKMQTDDVDFDADSGTRLITLTSQEGALESASVKIFLDTDLATTQAWITANLFTV